MSTKLINYFNFRQFGVKLFDNLALIHSVVWRYKATPLCVPYGDIEGFEYQQGHEYELKVQKTTLANPPADASNIAYKLLEIISDIPKADPRPQELPEEAKFKLQINPSRPSR